MSCTNPLYALDLGIKENGKRAIKILPRRCDLSSYEQLTKKYGQHNILPLPCGKCPSCKKAHARMWAIRCCLEASLYCDNCFITLTYNDENLPKDKKLDKKALQKFFDRLQHLYPGTRYFACGEYGDDKNTKRPHYHALIFGVYVEKKELEKLWPFGFVDVDELNELTAQYVARYNLKKQGDDDCFLIMSNRPGIGARWFEKHPDIYQQDAVIGPFGVASIPRYFDKLAELGGVDLSEIKAKRISKANEMQLYEILLHHFQRKEEMYQYNAEIERAKFENMKRRKGL